MRTPLNLALNFSSVPSQGQNMIHTHVPNHGLNFIKACNELFMNDSSK